MAVDPKPASDGQADGDNEPSKDDSSKFWPFVLTTSGFIALGLVALSVFAWHGCGGWAAWGVGVVAGGAAGVIGVVAGYVFGIPRTPEFNGTANGTPTETSGRTGIQYRANSSIEQISDWVVKILVGLGLTEIGNAPEGVRNLALAFEKALPGRTPAVAGDFSATGAFGASLVIYFAVLGFIAGYVHMRLFLAPEFRMADDRLNARVKQAHSDMEQAKKRADASKEQAADLERTSVQMGTMLYEPSRFDDAIAMAKAYVTRYGEPNDATFWLRYACAWGQRAQGVPSDYNAARAKAFEAAQRVVAISGELGKSWLRAHLEPKLSGPDADDDLVVFKKDPQFRALAGLPPLADQGATPAPAPAPAPTPE